MSHLFQKDSAEATTYQEKQSIRRLKQDQLDKLDAMLFGQSRKVRKDSIRGTDIPTEYIVLFAFTFIAAVGALVAWQIKKGSSTLPLASTNKRMD